MNLGKISKIKVNEINIKNDIKYIIRAMKMQNEKKKRKGNARRTNKSRVFVYFTTSKSKTS